MKTKCPCGKESEEHKETSNVGERQKLTGYRWLMTEVDSWWVCPECWDKLVNHYARIYSIVPDKYLVHPFLRKEAVGE